MPTIAYISPVTAYMIMLSAQYSQGLKRSGDLFLILHGSSYGSCYWIERVHMWITRCTKSG